MKSLYNKSTHSFQEQKQQEPPNRGEYYSQGVDSEWSFAEAAFEAANNLFANHIASLRTIPCRPGDVWEEGRLYEEGKDYRVSMDRPPFGGLCVMAIAPAPTDEAELWREAIAFMNKADRPVLEKLRQQYTLSRRGEQPEAVAFAEWVSVNDYTFMQPNKIWWHDIKEIEITSADLYKEFQFKQRK